MRVLVLGSYGLIGKAICQALVAQGHEVTGLGRKQPAPAPFQMVHHYIRADLSTLVTASAWRPHLDGIEVVVNAAGLLQDGPGDDVETVQFKAMVALYEACLPIGVRFLQISAAGAGEDAATLFMRSKAAADRALSRSGLSFVILRPALVVSPTAYGGTALIRALASIPFVTPLVFSETSIQCVSVADVARAAVSACAGEIPSGSVIELAEARGRTLAATVAMFRAWLGYPPAPIVRLPVFMARFVGSVADGLGRLGWRSPLRSTAMATIARGIETGADGAGDRSLLAPFASLEQILVTCPATPQERWFARLWLLKPLIVGLLALFWLASGMIAIFAFDQAATVLTTAGMGRASASLAVGLGIACDLSLGTAVLLRPWARRALIGMVVVSLGYLAAGSLIVPDLWLDPLGPLLKVLPSVLLALVGLAILEER